MAGSGKKTFTAGDVLTASDVNNYLMDQTVMVFGGTAARSSAIPTPSEGMFAVTTDNDELDYYDGSAWVPALPIGAWQTYAPTLSTGWTNGNGVYNAAKYCQIGKTVHVVIQFTTGNGLKGTTMDFSLPTASSTVGASIGLARFVVAGSTTMGHCATLTSGVCRVYSSGAAAAYVQQATITASVPGTWAASGDIIQLTLTYEAA